MHIKNNVILPVASKIHFLGHYIYPNYQVNIDGHMQHKINRKLSVKNISSYSAYHLPRKQAKQLSWRILSELDE